VISSTECSDRFVPSAGRFRVLLLDANVRVMHELCDLGFVLFSIALGFEGVV
jgi:hypothetical protein